MKHTVEKRKPSGIVDYIALSLTTFGVGYIPGAPGTYGSAVGVLIYIGTYDLVLAVSTSITSHTPKFEAFSATVSLLIVAGLTIFSLVGIWASGRSIPLLGNEDPSEAVVDEVIGQLITFGFIPFLPLSLSWPFILAGFLLFRLFDIWKPYPINNLQNLSGGLGICADDIVAGVYAGICLAIGYAIYLAI